MIYLRINMVKYDTDQEIMFTAVKSLMIQAPG
jgi:hypothetical protein